MKTTMQTLKTVFMSLAVGLCALWWPSWTMAKEMDSERRVGAAHVGHGQGRAFRPVRAVRVAPARRFVQVAPVRRMAPVAPAYPVRMAPAPVVRVVPMRPVHPVYVVGPSRPTVVAVAPTAPAEPVQAYRASPAAPGRPADPRLGLYLGLGGAGSFLVENRETDVTHLIKNGGGFELFGGLRMSRVLALELGWLASFHGTDNNLASYENGMLNGLTVDLKIFPVPSSMRIEPYLQIGGGFYAFNRTVHDDLSMTGGGFQAGGGVDLRLTDDLSLGLRLLYRGIYMDNSESVDNYATFYEIPYFESTFMNSITLSASFKVTF